MKLTPSEAPSPAQVLEPYRKLRIPTLLGRLPDSDNAEPTIALFALVYQGARNVDHDAAVAVADELLRTRKTVGNLIDGWRPRALNACEGRA